MKIARNKNLIFVIALLALTIGLALEHGANYFQFENVAWKLIKAICAIVFFWCGSFVILWSWFKNEPQQIKGKNLGKQIVQSFGFTLEWFFAIVITLWYTGLTIMCIFNLYGVVNS
jgi:hypothetical protein